MREQNLVSAACVVHISEPLPRKVVRIDHWIPSPLLAYTYVRAFESLALNVPATRLKQRSDILAHFLLDGYSGEPPRQLFASLL